MIKVKSISVKPDTVAINRGGTATLRATLSPENATNQTLNWTSSNPGVATVNDGVVTGISVGNTFVSARTTDGSDVVSSCVVWVTDDILVSSITVNYPRKILGVGNDCFLEAVISPSNATNCEIKWVSDNPGVATVNPVSGHVYAQGTGTTTIRAIPKDYSGKEGCCKITVTTPRIKAILDNIQNCSNSIIYDSRKNICVELALQMITDNYELSFVSGVLANIMSEGDLGQFEIYGKDYTHYLDTDLRGPNYYSNNFSGKTIMEVNFQEVLDMIYDLKTRSNNSAYIDGKRVGFGLGCIQWSFTRTYKLADFYKEEAGESTTITTEQAISAEVKMVIYELSFGAYKSIEPSWRNSCININSSEAAYIAGSTICQIYVVPGDTANQMEIRGKRAKAIYEAINV